MNRRTRHIGGVAAAGSGGPSPLSVTVTRTVRFEEVDALGVMWHGRYASWLEDGREALGALYGIGYLDFRGHGVIVPLKLFTLDFHQPLRYGQAYGIVTELSWNEAAVLDFAYRIEDAAGSVMTTASTTQLMLSTAGDLLMEQPAFYRDFCAKWQSGGLP